MVVYDYRDFLKRPSPSVVGKIKEPQPVYQDCFEVTLTMPYVSGFLACREMPHYLTALDRLRQSKSGVFPDVVLVDGYGVLHPQGFGAASHLGVVAGHVRTIGVGKSLLNVDGLEEHTVRETFAARDLRKGEHMDIVGASGKTWGAALKSTDEPHSKNAVYVSVGHKMDLPSALAICKRLRLFRVPEPIRMADQLGRAAIRKMELERK